MIWIQPLLLTFQLMLLSAIIAASIGVPIAFFISIANSLSIGHVSRLISRFTGGYVVICLITCLATPLVLHAAAWESTAGKFGWLTFSQTAARTYTGLAGRYSGMVACAWVHGLFGAAMVAMATLYGVARVPRQIIETARLDGGPMWTWWRVQFPIARFWWLTAILATMILAATEMTVVDLYGVRTLADEFYLFHAANPSWQSVGIYLVLPSLSVLGLLAAGVLRRNPDRESRLLDRDGEATEFDCSSELATGRLAQSGHRVFWSLSVAAAWLLATLLVVFPMAGLVLKAGHQVTVTSSGAGDSSGTDMQITWTAGKAMQTLSEAPAQFLNEYRWTALLAFVVGMLVVPLAWLAASLSRRRRRLGWGLDVVSLISFLIPGPIVGITVIWCFMLPVPGFRQLYHETLVPTLVALSARALPVGYWVMRAAYAGLDRNILDTAALDFGWAKRMLLVERRLVGRALAVTGVSAAIMASGDVPVLLPVLPPGLSTVGTRLFSLLHSGARHQEAALAFWYVIAIVLAAVLIAITWKRPSV